MGDADLWIKIWEALHNLAEKGISVEVEHVKEHRAQKEKEHMSHFEMFVTEGNEKADELAKGALLDEGFMEEVCAALQCAASLHCLVEQWKDCEEHKPKPKER